MSDLILVVVGAIFVMAVCFLCCYTCTKGSLRIRLRIAFGNFQDLIPTVMTVAGTVVYLILRLI